MGKSKRPSSENAESKKHGEEVKSEAQKFCSMPSYPCEYTHVHGSTHTHTHRIKHNKKGTCQGFPLKAWLIIQPGCLVLISPEQHEAT